MRLRRTICVIGTLLAALLLGGCSLGQDLVTASFAIVYGVAQYSDAPAYFDLAYTDDDARAVAELLESRGYEVILRLDSQATKSQLQTDFDDVAERAGPHDTVLFYFAGHGFGDGMESQYRTLPDEWHKYFDGLSGEQEPDDALPYTEYAFLYGSMPISSEVEATLSRAVSDAELAALFEPVPARNRIVIIDACHSGGFLPSSTGTDTVPRNFTGTEQAVSLGDMVAGIRTYLGGRAEDAAMVVLSAAGEAEFSWESGTNRHGVFTFFLLEALQIADHNGDGYVTVSEAYAHAAGRIMAEWNQPLAGIRSDGYYTFYPRVGTTAVDPVLVALVRR